MNTAQIIEIIKEKIDKGIADMTDAEQLQAIPKINSAVNMHCVDKIMELTQMDE